MASAKFIVTALLKILLNKRQSFQIAFLCDIYVGLRSDFLLKFICLVFTNRDNSSYIVIRRITKDEWRLDCDDRDWFFVFNDNSWRSCGVFLQKTDERKKE